ncbi:M23 family metallopeptidase [Anaerotruncus colihominis]|uniref:M23 family metallopeptidase n=1 Tax=Anaerotruncus colihominis TaxID=169435 RepID=UPI001D4141E7|nr:M23 family metallopeptidase [Anaerotruncus colihominis]HJF55664.1 M23 family metallopeptidase [Anaerotruncus colihominis]
MNDSYNPKSKFSKFMAGKGFYIALAICVVGAGTAAWVAVDKTIDRIDQNNNEIIEQQQTPSTASTPEPTYGFPDLEEAGKAQSGVGVDNSKPSASSSSSTASSSPSAAAPAASEPSAEVKAQPEPQPSSFILPLSGEIFAPYSNNELVKNVTLKEWRTHDGIDIKAEKGASVKAACDGKVSAVRDDPLMGMTVEITHHDDIVSIYCGLDKNVLVKEGDTVQVGQAIGAVGEIPSEIALDPHLHFAMKVAGKWADPLKTMGKVTE